MEAQEQEPNQDYLKGYNNGYLLARHEPELAAQLTRQPNEQNSYFKAFAAGKEQYDKEVLEWSKSFSKGAPAKEDPSKHKER